MKLKNTCALALVAGSLLLCGCASNKDYGTVLGGATGAIIGNQLGGGVGNIAATAIGAVAGAWVGSRVGERLDDNDRRRLDEDSRHTAETGEPYSYYNPDTRVRTRTHVIRNERIDSRTCRIIRQTVIRPNGEEVTEDVRTCRGSRGWERY